VLADAEMQVPAAETAGLEVAAPANVRSVLLDEPRSADPPSSQGMFWASTLSTFPDASRPAMPFGSAGKIGSPRSHPAGSSRRCIRSISVASSGYFAR
jgi:hypothetical protein